MATREYMKSEYPVRGAQPKAKSASHGADQRSLVEIILAAAGFAAWIWCAYEVARALIH